MPMRPSFVRSLLVLMAAVAAALSLGACGGSVDGASGPDASGDRRSTDAATTDGGDGGAHSKDAASAGCTSDSQCGGSDSYCLAPATRCTQELSDPDVLFAPGTCHRSCANGGCLCTDDRDCPAGICDSDGKCGGNGGASCGATSPPLCGAGCQASNLREFQCPTCVCPSCPTGCNGIGAACCDTCNEPPMCQSGLRCYGSGAGGGYCGPPTKCGGLAGYQCPVGSFCISPTGCADCFGTCVTPDQLSCICPANQALATCPNAG